MIDLSLAFARSFSIISLVQIIFDQGQQFHGDVFNVVAAQLGVQQMFTSTYHPNKNGLTEHLNKTLKKDFVAYIDLCHKTWDQILIVATHTLQYIRTSVNTDQPLPNTLWE